MAIPYSPVNAGQQIAGKVSWFGGPNDASDSGHTASGGTTAEPGIAVYNRATLGGYWEVTDKKSGKSAVLKQTDLGPSPSTGRAIDVTYSAIPEFGYSENNFPTDSEFTAKYLGRSPSRAVTHTGAAMSATDAAVGHASQAAAAAPVPAVASATPGTAASAAQADLLSRLLGSSSSAWDIGKPTATALQGFDPASSLRAAGLFTPPPVADASQPAAATQDASQAPATGTGPAAIASGRVPEASSVSAAVAPKGLVSVPVAAAGPAQRNAPGGLPPMPSTFLTAAKAKAKTPVAVQLYEGIPASLKAGLAKATPEQLSKFGYERLPGSGAIVKKKTH